MKLFIFGKEINSGCELELILNDEFGLDITIKYIDDVYNGVEDIKHNCTEFHHRYNEEWGKDYPDEVSSAFESDIHSTGSTRRVNMIEWIKVEKANVLHDNY